MSPSILFDVEPLLPITHLNLNTIPKYSKIFLSFGEIDCRPDEGLLKAARKSGADLKELVLTTVEGYLDWFFRLNKQISCELYFLTVPAPVYDNRFSEAVNKEVVEVRKIFNICLMDIALKYNFYIIDLYTPTKNADGYSNMLYHVDSAHLGYEALELIQNHLKLSE